MGKLVRTVAVTFLLLFCCSCGYSKEEKQYMKEIEESGKMNAVNYIQEKYGFTPEIIAAEVCKEGSDGDPFPSANGYVLVTMNYGDKTFRVKINGEEPVQQGLDDYQHDQIAKEAKEYFESLLGYDIYDLYLEYKEAESSDADNWYEERNMLYQWYEAGNLEEFLKNHPANIRVDDCTDRDLTNLPEDNSKAAAFLEMYSKDYKVNTILISYKSEKDYENGREHTYGRGGVMDFDIWKDGLYIRSYQVFEKEKNWGSRFSQQEYDGIVFSYEDQEDGVEPVLSGDEWEWRDLGETRGKPVSKIYSVRTSRSGEIAVYIPTDTMKQYQAATVYIQHSDDNKWWQYEPNLYKTKDKNYLLFVYQGIDHGSFDFGIFK